MLVVRIARWVLIIESASVIHGGRHGVEDDVVDPEALVPVAGRDFEHLAFVGVGG